MSPHRIWSPPPINEVRRAAAVTAGRGTARLPRRVGHHRPSLPGLVAERLDPHILTELRAGVGPVVVVLGTNGKTTTTRLITTILRGTGSTPITNRSGANLRQGLVTALIADRREHPDRTPR